MTIEELRLRVMAAFPGAAPMSSRGRDTPEIGTIVEADGVEMIVAWCDCVDCRADQGELWSAATGGSFEGSWADGLAAVAETKRRILAVSAHQLIAARRRRMETADAH